MHCCFTVSVVRGMEPIPAAFARMENPTIFNFFYYFTVVGTRYTLGVAEVTEDDQAKKEIIQMLCIKPMPYPELNK